MDSKVNKIFSRVRINTNWKNEKINQSTIQKEVDSIVSSLNTVDKSLYNIATTLQQNNMYGVRKDVLSFIANINEMYQYLVVDLNSKINPQEEEK